MTQVNNRETNRALASAVASALPAAPLGFVYAIFPVCRHAPDAAATDGYVRWRLMPIDDAPTNLEPLP